MKMAVRSLVGGRSITATNLRMKKTPLEIVCSRKTRFFQITAHAVHAMSIDLRPLNYEYLSTVLQYNRWLHDPTRKSAGRDNNPRQRLRPGRTANNKAQFGKSCQQGKTALYTHPHCPHNTPTTARFQQGRA